MIFFAARVVRYPPMQNPEPDFFDLLTMPTSCH